MLVVVPAGSHSVEAEVRMRCKTRLENAASGIVADGEILGYYSSSGLSSFVSYPTSRLRSGGRWTGTNTLKFICAKNRTSSISPLPLSTSLFPSGRCNFQFTSRPSVSSIVESDI